MTSEAAVRLLLATDFDGTVAPIQLRPEEVSLDPRFEDFFASLSERTDIAIAFVSGRDLADLTQRTGRVRAWRSGSHGRELAAPDGSILRETPLWSGTIDDKWLSAARAAGLRLERKRAGVAVHWRGAPSIDRNHPLVREFASWGEQHGLTIVEGRSVAEATVPGATKRDVLKMLAASTRAKRVVYAGDDLTDVDALAWAAARGRGFFVRSEEREEPLPHKVECVSGRAELLEKFREEADPKSR